MQADGDAGEEHEAALGVGELDHIEAEAVGRGVDALAEAVRRCWASAVSARVAAYRPGRGTRAPAAWPSWSSASSPPRPRAWPSPPTPSPATARKRS